MYKDSWLHNCNDFDSKQSQMFKGSVTSAASGKKRENRSLNLRACSQTGQEFLVLLLHFQGPKHSLPSSGLLAGGAGTLSWHGRYLMPLQKYLPFLQGGPLIIAGDSTDKYILEMVLRSPLLLLFLYMPMHNLEEWNGPALLNGTIFFMGKEIT